jgi:hypothetical protein
LGDLVDLEVQVELLSRLVRHHVPVLAWQRVHLEHDLVREVREEQVVVVDCVNWPSKNK